MNKMTTDYILRYAFGELGEIPEDCEAMYTIIESNPDKEITDYLEVLEDYEGIECSEFLIILDDKISDLTGFAEHILELNK